MARSTTRDIRLSWDCWCIRGLRELSISLPFIVGARGCLADEDIWQISILANVLWCTKINRDKKNGKYDQYIGSGDDRDPGFKMIL